MSHRLRKCYIATLAEALWCVVCGSAMSRRLHLHLHLHLRSSVNYTKINWYNVKLKTRCI